MDGTYRWRLQNIAAARVKTVRAAIIKIALVFQPNHTRAWTAPVAAMACQACALSNSSPCQQAEPAGRQRQILQFLIKYTHGGTFTNYRIAPLLFCVCSCCGGA